MAWAFLAALSAAGAVAADAVPPLVAPRPAPAPPREAASEPASGPAEETADRTPQPLALRGGRADEVIHALMVISAGDAEAIGQLSPDLFHADVAVPDRADGDLGRRWSQLVPRAIARLASPARGLALAGLDALCRKDLALASDARERALRAEDFLPAPTAIAELTLASARAFDHGRFADVLLAELLLTPASHGGSDVAGVQRAEAALLLSARGPVVDALARLIEPGTPVRISSAAPAPKCRGLAVGWSTQRGWLLALDDAGRVLWQYRVELGADVVPGAGATLVRDSAGLRAIDEQGVVSTLTPPPGDTRCLSVTGGAAWFATGERAWRLPFPVSTSERLSEQRSAPGETPLQLDLGAEPLCPPLVRGGRSLWLTRDELLLFELGTRVHRIRHFLDAQPGWRLSADGLGGTAGISATIIATDGTAWRLEPFATQLAEAAPVARARLLTQASRWSDALDELARSSADAATAEGRQVAFAAHAGMGPEHVARCADEVAALAQSADEQAAVWYARFRADFSTERPSEPDRARAHAQALVSFLHAHPDTLIAWSPAEIGTPSASWSHAVDGATLALALERWLAGAPVGRTGESLVRDAPVAMPAGMAADPEDALVLDPQLGQAHLHAGTLIQLDHGQGFTRLTCRDAGTRRLRWRHRWPADPTVHSRSLAITDGCALVAEGPSRLVVLDAATGERRLVAISSGIDLLPSQTRVLSRTRLAMLSQFAAADELVMVDAALDASRVSSDGGAERGFTTAAPVAVATRVALPGSALWMVPLPGRHAALVLLGDHRAFMYPPPADQAGHDPKSVSVPIEVKLPEALRGAHPPVATREGLAVDDRLYPWAAATGE